jgi:bacteriorhodopsin
MTNSLYSNESKTPNTPPPPVLPNGATKGKSIVLEDAREKQSNPVKYYVKFSFAITYILLLTTATITLIEALRTKTPYVRHILNLETAISVVAGYFYSVFVSQIEKFSDKGIDIDWADISKTRYIDWSITTPLMLLALCLVLSSNIQKVVTLPVISFIVLLNYIMLYIGYLGENKLLDRYASTFLGFIPFGIMFSIIYYQYVRPGKSFVNTVLFTMYLTIWSIYGIVYMFNEEYKNIMMNILDATSKCLIGLGLWAYYSKIITF